MRSGAVDTRASGRPSPEEALYARLLGPETADVSAGGDPNRHFLAQMLACALVGRGALPALLGLREAAFAVMVETMFPAFGLPPAFGAAPSDDRYEEIEDVRALLAEHRAGRFSSEVWIVEIVSAGCMASDHLWSDLGLFSRGELTAMLMVNFPALAGRNTQNMKWKKFLYKQLCEAEGLFICRAPSCQVCDDYAKCFILPDEDGGR